MVRVHVPTPFLAHAGLSLLLSASSLPAAAQLVSTGLSVTLDQVDYYISPFSSGNVSSGLAGLSSVPAVFGFRPVTVVGTPTARSELEALFANWTAIDDVFRPGFLGAVFLAGEGVACITKKDLAGAGSPSAIIPLATDSGAIPSGPYFLEAASGRLFPVYRLYVDFAGAFSESLLQRPDGAFQPLSAQVSASSSLTVGVPSRLYYSRTAEKPLAGVRIGVKDIFALKGVKRSNGNRAWHQLYPPAAQTAPSVQRLVDAGAVIVGLQKPSQFANGESPTGDWVDYHAPFNPRGDGYQDPSSSSSGAGASVASYDWLDMAVGSDTGGSIRGPSGAQGLFGNRPSHGLVSLDEVMPLSPALDTAGFLLRDPHLWDAANSVLFAGSSYTSLAGRAPSYPKTIYTLGFPLANSTAPSSVLLNKFVLNLADFVGGGTVMPLNIADEWARTQPAEARGAPLGELLGASYAVLITKHQTRLVRDPFYQDYAAAFDGRTPFVNPVPLARWAYGDSLPDTALDEAVRNKTLFMDWFNDAVLPAAKDPAQCSSSLMLYVMSTGSGQSYRNTYQSAPGGPPIGFSSGRISVMAELPDSVFPLGEVTAQSSISHRDERYPVAVSVVAAKGCDGLLAKLATDLTDAGILTPPRVGRTLLGGVAAMK